MIVRYQTGCRAERFFKRNARDPAGFREHLKRVSSRKSTRRKRKSFGKFDGTATRNLSLQVSFSKSRSLRRFCRPLPTVPRSIGRRNPRPTQSDEIGFGVLRPQSRPVSRSAIRRCGSRRRRQARGRSSQSVFSARRTACSGFRKSNFALRSKRRSEAASSASRRFVVAMK